MALFSSFETIETIFWKVSSIKILRSLLMMAIKEKEKEFGIHGLEERFTKVELRMISC
jgi:hypothetical protein